MPFLMFLPFGDVTVLDAWTCVALLLRGVAYGAVVTTSSATFTKVSSGILDQVAFQLIVSSGTMIAPLIAAVFFGIAKLLRWDPNLTALVCGIYICVRYAPIKRGADSLV